MNQSEVNSASLSNVTTFYTGVAGMFFCNLIVNFPANIYVVWLILSKGGRSVTSEFFGLNLAISEIIFCLSSIYLLFHYLLRMAVGFNMLLLNFFLMLMLVSRPVFHCCICLERFLAVVHPTTFLRLKPLRYKIAFCMVTWLLLLLFCILPSLTYLEMQGFYQLMGQSLVFLVLMSYCGVHVLCVLKQPGPSDGERHHESQNLVKKKAFNVIMITLVFTSSTELIQILMMVSSLIDMSRETTLVVSLAFLAISTISGFITPLLYLHRARKLPCISECGLTAS